jgi:signal transduction histidine kinase
MMSVPADQASSSPKVPGHELYVWLWLGVLFAALHSVLTWTGFGPWRLELGSLTRLATGPIAVTAMVIAALRHYRRGRASALWLTGSLAMWWFADALYSYAEVIAHWDVRNVSFLGVPYLLAVLMMLVAVILLPKPQRSRNEALSILAETMIVIVASITAMWRGFIAQNLVDQKWNWIAVSFDLIGPFIGMGVLGFLFLTILRQRERILGAYNWLAVGIICFGGVMQGADFIRGQGGVYFTGHPIDALSSWGNVLLLSAVLTGVRPRVQQPLLFTRFWSSALTGLPYLAVIANYWMLYAFITRREYDASGDIKELGLLIGVGIVTALVVLRQLLMILENRSLNESLERRVAQRGLELEISQTRLNASERLASLGQLTAGLAHEVNTPLATAMTGVLQAQGLAQEYKQSIGATGVADADHREIAGELEASLTQVAGTLNRLGELIRKMRAQGRNTNEGAIRFNPFKTAQDALVMLEHAALQAKVNLQLEANAETNLQVHGDPVRFAQVVTNLTQNAIHACEDGRKAEGSKVRLFFTHDQEHVILHVSDNGSGIPEQLHAQIFDPLFTTKVAGRGTGLGLSIIKDIVASHFSGQIDFETQAGQGTTFKVCFKHVHPNLNTEAGMPPHPTSSPARSSAGTPVAGSSPFGPAPSGPALSGPALSGPAVPGSLEISTLEIKTPEIKTPEIKTEVSSQ